VTKDMGSPRMITITGRTGVYMDVVNQIGGVNLINMDVAVLIKMICILANVAINIAAWKEMINISMMRIEVVAMVVQRETISMEMTVKGVVNLEVLRKKNWSTEVT
jgi:Tfp pilus assembly protein PilO